MITSERQAEKAYKSLVHGKSTTGSGDKAFYLEPSSEITIKSDKVLTQFDLIPVSAPTANDGDIFDTNGVVSTGGGYDGVPIVEYHENVVMELIAGTDRSYIIVGGEINILKFDLLDGIYAPVVKNQSGVVIPNGQNSWELDTNAGVITFFDGNIGGVTGLQLTYWKYVGKTLSDGDIDGGAVSPSKSYILASDNLVDDVTVIDDDIDGTDDTFVVVHGLDSDILNFTVKQGNEIIEPHRIRIIDTNIIWVEFRPSLPVDVDLITIDIIDLSASQVISASSIGLGNVENESNRTVRSFPTEETDDFTPSVGSDRNYYKCNFSTDKNITIEAATVTEIGESIYFRIIGTNAATFIESGVTISKNVSDSLTTGLNGDTIELLKTGTLTYDYI